MHGTVETSENPHYHWFIVSMPDVGYLAVTTHHWPDVTATE